MAGCSNSRGAGGGNSDENCKGKFSCGDCFKKGGDVKDRVPGGLFDQAVLVSLRSLYAKKVISDIRVSLGGGRSVGLFSLLYFVWERGGFDSMSIGNLWELASKELDLDFGFGTSLKLVYFNYFGELDQWLDGIGKRWNFMILSGEAGCNFEMLSIELEKRFKALSSKVGKIEKKVMLANGCNNICNRSCKGVTLKEDLQTPGGGKGNQFADDANVAAAFDNDERERDIPLAHMAREALRKRNCPNIGLAESDSWRRWKKMLSWLSRTAKKPLLLPSRRIQSCSERKEKGRKKYMPLVLMAREALLKRKYPNSDEKNGSCPQKKQKIHPSMYDDPASSHLHVIRSSKRVPALAKACKESKTESLTQATHLENGHRHKEKKTPVVLAFGKPSKKPSPYELPVKMRARVGPRYQAKIPPWTGRVVEDYSNCLGDRVWPPDNWVQNTAPVTHSILGKGRPEICDCTIPLSVDCVRLHTAENKLKLKKELGRVFYQWKFDRMGEVVSISWTPEEEEEFKSVMTSNPPEEEEFKSVMSYNPPNMGKLSFTTKTRLELVDYYFNVFLQRKRSYQNRVTPDAVDSDDEQSDFGSVGGLYGHAATRYLNAPTGAAPDIKLGSCTQNQECVDLNSEGEE